MSKNKDNLVVLKCTKCNEENYHTFKNRKIHQDKLEFSKYCSKCKIHTPHKEIKKKG